MTGKLLDGFRKPGPLSVRGSSSLFACNSSDTLSVCFQRIDGSRTAIEYGHLVAVSMVADDAVVAIFTRHRVLMHGAHLLDLFDHLAQHRAALVVELDELRTAKDGDTVFVREIVVEAM